MNELCDRLHRAANVEQIIALLIVVLGIIGGVVVAVDTDDIGNHMYVTEGVALVFASVVQAAVLYLFGVWGVAWAARNCMAR